MLGCEHCDVCTKICDALHPLRGVQLLRVKCGRIACLASCIWSKCIPIAAVTAGIAIMSKGSHVEMNQGHKIRRLISKLRSRRNRDRSSMRCCKANKHQREGWQRHAVPLHWWRVGFEATMKTWSKINKCSATAIPLQPIPHSTNRLKTIATITKYYNYTIKKTLPECNVRKYWWDVLKLISSCSIFCFPSCSWSHIWQRSCLWSSPRLAPLMTPKVQMARCCWNSR